MTFTQRMINVSFSLANGNFQGGGNTANFSGLRISARIDGPGGMTGITLSMSIWGMSLSDMNQLSTVGQQFRYMYKNQVTVTAGDAIAGMQLVFQGNVTSAYVDAQSQPQVAFRVEAQPGAYLNVQSTQPTSVKGQADVAQLMQQLAQQAGLQFQNNGVNIKLRNPYLPGAIGNQIRTLAHMAGIEHIIDRGKLSIWMAGQATGNNIVISPQTGMVGYPTFNQNSIYVKTIFNPTIQNSQKITVQSDLTPACGTWQVFHVCHEIECQLPKGKWFSIIGATPLQSDVGSN